ncbi:thermonuclease family protein (plasmid) [Rhizobium oryzihabitans]|uniref:Thermonuclease family protein n=1 Tax=Rhizobium oryzihabitans TaxID=2267833 RepID=A0A7L5BRR2_9HYPH|nr:thermonuclease family protein [Rhizobium oryzihabitans]
MVGYDAPEAGEGARCGQERALADRATQQLQRLMSTPGIQYRDQGEDRYGRVLTQVMTQHGDIADQMIKLGLGHAYRGGYRDRNQCVSRKPEIHQCDCTQPRTPEIRTTAQWTMEANEIDEMARHVEACAASAAEFTFSFLDADPKDDTSKHS